jgi:hypothetical protein
MIGDGGVVGWLAPETVEYPDESQPTLSYIQLSYKGSGITQDSCNFVWMTNDTQANIRSTAKDRIRQDIIDKLGVTIPKAQIKMLNSPE